MPSKAQSIAACNDESGTECGEGEGDGSKQGNEIIRQLKFNAFAHVIRVIDGVAY